MTKKNLLPKYPATLDKDDLMQLLIMFTASGYAQDFDDMHDGSGTLQAQIMDWLRYLAGQESYPIDMDYSDFIGTEFEQEETEEETI